MSPEIAVNRAEKRRSGFYYPLLIFFICLAPKVIPALQGRLTADACRYLDIVRNLLAGRGLVISYNALQYWVGSIDYPALPYMPFLFSLVVTPVYFLFKTVVSVSLFNVGIAAINATCIYFILFPRYKTCVAFWAAILVGLSPQMGETATMPWTEQLHLFFLLIGLFLVLRSTESGSRRQILLAGIVMGINCFVRFASVFIVVAFLIALFFWAGFSKKSFQLAAVFLLGFSAIIIPYELFCLTRYHEFYPSYSKQAVVSRSSQFVLGATYETIRPVLRIPSISFQRKLVIGVRSLPRHVANMFKQIGLISLFFIPATVWIWRRRRPLEILFWTTGVTNIIFYAGSFYWLPRLEQAAAFRFSLISIVCFLPLVLMMIDDIATVFLVSALKTGPRAVFLYFVFIFILLYGTYALRQNLFFTSPKFIAQKHHETRELHSVFRWIQAHTKHRELVATEVDAMQKIFPLDRPIVSLPFASTLTTGKMERYLAIYQPHCVLVAKKQDIYRKFLEEFHYQLAFGQGPYLVFMHR